ncbi:MAG TPA: hypothetical protein PKV96_02395 [Candidatus Saccharimonas sp.]|jgi:hypothetical protein|nr:hypothetical protein [Candidatus Saccharimonas sp.]
MRTPSGHVLKNWQQSTPFIGEFIAVIELRDNIVMLKHFETLGKCSRVDIVNSALDSAESLGATTELTNNQRRPFTAKDVGSGAYATRFHVRIIHAFSRILYFV